MREKWPRLTLTKQYIFCELKRDDLKKTLWGKEKILETRDFPHFSTSFISTVNPFPNDKRQILDSSQQKGFAEDKFIFHENGIKLSIWVENTEGKGDIACYEQFLLLPQCFQKTYTADT